MDDTLRKDIHPGLRVAIVKRESRRSREATYRVARLETGEVGRVRYIEV